MGSPNAPFAPFRVTGRRRNRTTTYLCPDAAWAWRKHRDFDKAEYEEIAIQTADGTPVGAAEIERLAQAVAAPETTEP